MLWKIVCLGSGLLQLSSDAVLLFLLTPGHDITYSQLWGFAAALVALFVASAGLSLAYSGWAIVDAATVTATLAVVVTLAHWHYQLPVRHFLSKFSKG